MSLELPRINILISDTKGVQSEGELSTLSVGFGIHQAWIYAAMFGTSALYQTREVVSLGAIDAPGLAITELFLSSIIAFALTLFFAGITDQKLLRIYTSKTALYAAAIVTCLGTFLIFPSGAQGPLGTFCSITAGITTGIGSAFLLVFWGTAFARNSSSSIVINTVFGIVVAIVIYTLILYVVPNPFAGACAALLPLAELPFLARRTPKSYILRHEIPIFKPLPVKKGSFCLRFGFPVLLAGFSLGALRTISIQIALPVALNSGNALIVIAVSFVVVALLALLLIVGAHRYWDSMFRSIVPLCMATLCFVPAALAETSVLSAGALTTGYMCLEALMWIFFGQICQSFRLSSVFVFGIGRGCLALGSLLGTLAVAHSWWLDGLTPFGQASSVLFYIAALVVAYIALPRVTDIKRMIDPSFERRYSPIDVINEEAARLGRIIEDVPNAPSASGAPGAQEADETQREGDLTQCAETDEAPRQTTGANETRDQEAASGSTGALIRNAGSDGGSTQATLAENTLSEGTVDAADANGARTSLATVSASSTLASESASSPNATKPAKKAKVSKSNASSAKPNADGDAASSSRKHTGVVGASGKAGKFRTQCEAIANLYLLSRRETEVLFLLAKGHNAAYIQKKLYISQSTAKTHIYHIYQKLDIHTQQELLTMVSDMAAKEDV